MFRSPRAFIALLSLGLLAGCNLTVTVMGNGTVTSSPERIECPGSACSATFGDTTMVTLIPAAGVSGGAASAASSAASAYWTTPAASAP